MAIVHTFIEAQDQFTLNVSQDTGYTLAYISNGNATTVTTGTLLANNSVVLPVTIDGFYRLTLVVEGETDVVIDFHVKYNLRNSIIVDALYLLCGDCDCLSTNANADCISKIARKCLKHKAIFTKLLTYRDYYLPLFETDYTGNLQAFINIALDKANCNVQKVINSILNEECITGAVKDTDRFFQTFFAIYYLGFYQIELLEAQDQDQIDYINEVYKFERISECICELGLGVDNVLDDFPTDDGSVVIKHWQFDDTVTDITFAPSIDLPYLADKDAITLAAFEAGSIFTYAGVGRIAFAIRNITQDQYRIEDTFGEDVTAVVFDTYWNVGLNMQVYISKEYYAAPSIYFQLVEN